MRAPVTLLSIYYYFTLLPCVAFHSYHHISSSGELCIKLNTQKLPITAGAESGWFTHAFNLSTTVVYTLGLSLEDDVRLPVQSVYDKMTNCRRHLSMDLHLA